MHAYRGAVPGRFESCTTHDRGSKITLRWRAVRHARVYSPTNENPSLLDTLMVSWWILGLVD